ncbi:MAG TPA: amidophosphoribosyltransferase, partial [Anaerolineales bacterium]|nr:amidophosphoribosyltransferase [Anaerolineales bacterium]
PSSLSEECGVFGISTIHNDVARLTYFGLFALQHRGQEAAGIAVSDGRAMHMHKGVGLVSQVFDETMMQDLKGDYAIGHTRYSTTGSSHLRNAQPFQLETRHGPIALAHNGNLVNATELRETLFARGVPLTSSSDSEVMAVMLAGAPGDTMMDRIAHCMTQWVGAYSLVILTRDGVYAARDPWGLRPLTVGALPDSKELCSGGHAVASETGALETIGCTAVREVKPGEIVALHKAALIVRQAMQAKTPLALCTFEHVYFSRPDSVWDGKVVHNVRVRLGERLAAEAPVEADFVIPVPDSSIPAAIGYARASGIPFEMGLIKNRYIGRTFIQPSQEMRERGVYMKFNPVPQVLDGKRIVVIDDSIVRGTTSRRLVNMLRDAGATEVHMRITCPPIMHPCFMGVDMPTHEELIAYNKTPAEICEYMGADSLHYLSLDGMMGAIGSQSGYCNACFTGVYPFPLGEEVGKSVLELA